MRSVVRAAVVSVSLAGLAGCSSLVPGADRDPPNLYDLSPKNTFSEKLPSVKWQLLVEPPVAAAGLSSSRIALKQHHLKLEYFAKVAWTDTTPKMVQNLMVESFENSGKIISVSRQAVGLRADYQLSTVLREFQAEYMANPAAKGAPPRAGKTGPAIRVRVSAKLIQMPERVIIASQAFEGVRQARGNNMTEIVDAYDRALGRVLKRLVEWSLTTAHDDWKKKRRRGRRYYSSVRR